MKKNTLFELTDTVYKILKTRKRARDNDDILYIAVCKTLNPKVMSTNFEDVMRHRVKYGIPVYESVRRVRQKLQADNVELRGKTYTQQMRSKKRNEYLAYSKFSTKR